MSADHRDIIERLDEIIALKSGDPLPPGWDQWDWSIPMSALLKAARDEIVSLRTKGGGS